MIYFKYCNVRFLRRSGHAYIACHIVSHCFDWTYRDRFVAIGKKRRTFRRDYRRCGAAVWKAKSARIGRGIAAHYGCAGSVVFCIIDCGDVYATLMMKTMGAVQPFTRAAFSVFHKKKGVVHHEDRPTKAIFL